MYIDNPLVEPIIGFIFIVIVIKIITHILEWFD
jgi:hypothetical protein